MELTNEFRVGVPVGEAWAVLTDVERIAPCLPGAQLQEIEGDEYRGIVKVKVGPITAQYKGKAAFQSRDDDAHVAVLKAEGRDTRGQGNASALITATLTPDGAGTQVKVVTDLTITGKVAQFGRGVLVDVSGKLLTQFVGCLENDLLTGDGGGEAASSATPPHGDPLMEEVGEVAPATAPAEAPGSGQKEPGWAPAAAAPAAATAVVTDVAPSVNGTPAPEDVPSVRKIDHESAAPVDLLDAAGVPVAKRAIPVVAGVLLILWFLRRHRGR